MGKSKHGKDRKREEYHIGVGAIKYLPRKVLMKTTKEVSTIYGRVDIVINLDRPVLIEVKVNFKDVRAALGQLLFFAECFPDPELFICCKEEIPEKYLPILDKYGVKDWRTEKRRFKLLTI